MLCNGAGFYVYYVLQLQQIRMEMRHALKQIPDHLLECIKLSNNDFEQAKVEDHEVKVGGKMYDIARIRIKDDSVYVYCLHDEKEDDLIALVDYLVSCPVGKKDSMPGVVIHFLSLTFLIPVTEFELKKANVAEAASTPYTVCTYSFFKEINSPPPQT